MSEGKTYNVVTHTTVLVTPMSDHANPGDELDRAEAALPEADAQAEATIEAYETEDGVVFYDSRNPLAWLKAGEPLTLTEQV